MADTTRGGVPSAPRTPPDLADPAKHRQTQPFENDNRPQRTAPGNEGTDARFAAGEDMLGKGEQTVGQSPGPDTSGVVAPPAERNRPGASVDLGGTPGATAMPSGGRDTDY